MHFDKALPVYYKRERIFVIGLQIDLVILRRQREGLDGT